MAVEREHIPDGPAVDYQAFDGEEIVGRVYQITTSPRPGSSQDAHPSARETLVCVKAVYGTKLGRPRGKPSKHNSICALVAVDY